MLEVTIRQCPKNIRIFWHNLRGVLQYKGGSSITWSRSNYDSYIYPGGIILGIWPWRTWSNCQDVNLVLARTDYLTMQLVARRMPFCSISLPTYVGIIEFGVYDHFRGIIIIMLYGLNFWIQQNDQFNRVKPVWGFRIMYSRVKVEAGTTCIPRWACVRWAILANARGGISAPSGSKREGRNTQIVRLLHKWLFFHSHVDPR